MKNYKLTIVFLLALAVLAGCEGILDMDDNKENKTGSVIVKITDAPFPSDLVAEANVKIEGIKLKKVTESEEEDIDLHFLMMETDEFINLLDLQHGITEILAKMEIPTGEYNEIRLQVVEANVLLKDKNILFDMKIPGGNSSGLKIKIKPALYIDQSTESELLLDFDVNRSFKTIGNIKNKNGIKGFHFKPVIRAVSQAVTGQISGEVTNESDEKITGAYISLIQGTETISTSTTDEEGEYKIIGIPENEYTVVCEKEGYITKSQTVNIRVGKKTKQNFVLATEN